MLVVAFVAGAGAGWVLKPAPTATPPADAKSGERVVKRARLQTSERAAAVRRWIDRLESERAEEIAGEIPADELAPLLESVMASMWGSLGRGEVKRLEALVGEWARRDRESALVWARSLPHAKQREVGLAIIAGTVAHDDPQAAFEIYSQIEAVTIDYTPTVFFDMMRTVFQEATGEGVEAILDLVKRTPRNERGGMGLFEVEYPDGFDFSGLLDGLSELTSQNRSGIRRPLELNNPIGAWAVRDPDAAFAYVTERVSEGNHVRWGTLTYKLGKEWGTVEADEWVAAQLVAQRPEMQLALLRETDLAHSPGILRRYISRIPDEEAAMNFRQQVVAFAAESRHPGPYLEILNDIPEAAKRVALVETLRGVTDPGYLRHLMTTWGVPPERISEVVETVQQPAQE